MLALAVTVIAGAADGQPPALLQLQGRRAAQRSRAVPRRSSSCWRCWSRWRSIRRACCSPIGVLYALSGPVYWLWRKARRCRRRLRHELTPWSAQQREWLQAMGHEVLMLRRARSRDGCAVGAAADAAIRPTTGAARRDMPPRRGAAAAAPLLRALAPRGGRPRAGRRRCAAVARPRHAARQSRRQARAVAAAARAAQAGRGDERAQPIECAAAGRAAADARGRPRRRARDRSARLRVPVDASASSATACAPTTRLGAATATAASSATS